MRTSKLLLVLVLIIVAVFALAACETCDHEFAVSAEVDATCSKSGSVTYTCPKCEASYTKYTNPIDHVYTDKVVDASCTELGYTEHTCACGYSYKDSYTVVKAHTYTSAVTAATCSASGYTTYTCACGDSYKAEFTPVLEHTYTKKETVAPTHSNAGYTTYACVCGKSYQGDVVAPLGDHVYTKKVTAPTHTEDGYTTYTCTCGVSYKDEIVLALGHTYTVTETKATCTTDGSIVSVCSCGDKKEEKISAYGHKMYELIEIKEIACNENGHVKYKCSCGETVTQVMVASGHAFRYTETVPGTRVEGYSIYSCSCGMYYHDDFTPPATEMTIAEALAANEGDDVIVNGIVKSIDTAWDTKYNNITVTIVDAEGNTMTAFRLGTKVNVGDAVAVIGEIGVYKEVNQIAAGAFAEVTPCITIPEALDIADATKVAVTGTVKSITTAWSDSNGYMTAVIADADGKELEVYQLANKVEVGNVVVVVGKMATEGTNRRIAEGATAVVLRKVARPAGVYVFADYAEGTQYAMDEVHKLDGVLTVTTNDAHFTTQIRLYKSGSHDANAIFAFTKEVTSITINAGYKTDTLNVFVSADGTNWELAKEVEVKSSYADYTVTFDAAYKFIKLTATSQQIRVAAIAAMFSDGTGSTSTEDKTPGGGGSTGGTSGGLTEVVAPAGSTTVTKTMIELATANSWTNKTQYKNTAIALDSAISVTFNGGSNSGKYYDSDHIRIYATDSPAGTITISAAEGKTILYVKITTVTGTYAFLQLTGDATQDYSNLYATVNGSSITFNSVKNGNNGKQVRILSIEVIYK